MTYLLFIFFLFNTSGPTPLLTEAATNSIQSQSIEAHSDTIVPEQYDFLFNLYYFSNERVAIKDKQWGMIDSKGEIILPFEYDFLSNFERDSLCVFHKNDQWGTIHRNGTVTLVDDFNTLSIYQIPYKENRKYVCISGKCGVVDEEGKIIIPLIYNGMITFYNGVSCARLNYKSGIINESNEVVVPFEYQSTFDADKEGKKFVIRQNGKSGTMLLDGTMIIPMQYDHIRSSYHYPKYWFVEKNRKKGIIDRQGKVIVPVIYDELFTGKTIIVIKDGKSSVIHPDGHVIIPLTEGSLSRYDTKKQIYFLEKEGKLGLIDSLGKEIIAPEYEQISVFSFNYTSVKKDKKVGLLDLNYQLVIPPIYDKIEMMWIINHPGIWNNEEMASVIEGPYKSKKPQFLVGAIDETIDVFNHQGEKQFTLNDFNTQFTLDDFNFPISAHYLYSSKRFMFYLRNQKSKAIIIDDTGKEIMPAIYDQLTIFQDSLIKIEVGNKYGIANTKGEILLSPDYDFLQGRIIGKEGKKGFLKEDYSGIYGGLVFDDIQYQKKDELLFQKDGLWGMCKISEVAEILSNPFLPNKYQEIKRISRGYMAKKENQWLLFDSQGQSQLDMSFDTIIQNEKRASFLKLQKKNKWALYKFDSWKNDTIPKFIYDEIDGYTVRVGKKWGTVHSKSMQSIPIIYDEIKPEGFYTFFVRKENHWGCIDLYHQQSSPIEYDSIGWSNTEIIEAFKNKKVGIIDFDGNIIVPFDYGFDISKKEETISQNGLTILRKNQKYGIINKENKTIVPFEYEAILLVNNNKYLGRKNKKWMILTF